LPIGPALVHILTALGVVCALAATLAVAQGRYELMFAWLGLAFLIDGIDGPLARRVRIKQRLPRFDGERLDLIIDYLTYVFVPVLALINAGHLPPGFSIVIGAAILLSSLYHFSDTDSKADDNSFVGFPAIWNIVAFYVFVFQTPPWLAAAVCLVCIGLTFVPTRWVHPMRVEARRALTLAALAAWFIAAAAAVWAGFAATPLWAQAVLIAVGAYALAHPLLPGAKTPPSP
jgi:phosphatidylcholine synthase